MYSQGDGVRVLTCGIVSNAGIGARVLWLKERKTAEALKEFGHRGFGGNFFLPTKDSVECRLRNCSQKAANQFFSDFSENILFCGVRLRG